MEEQEITETTEKIDLFDLSQEDLEALMKELGQPKFRAKQLWEWIYHHLSLIHI